SGHLELAPAPIHLPALLEEIAAMVRVDAERKGLTFALDLPADLPAVVQADGKRMRQILLNLLGNAIKFTDAGEVTLSVKASSADEDRIRLDMSVEDTGMGIAPEDRTRIFAPFEQTEQGRRREAGVGLGLAISQELAHRMGGGIDVESRLGSGSRFRFTVVLPLVHEPEAVAPRRAHIAGYEGRRQSILVADDQEENRQLLRRMLETLGFEVALAGDGREAVAAASERQPDLVFMDLRMPGMNGFEAARAIRHTVGLERVPVVAASASGADLEHAEAEVDTFAACLRKPFQTSDLIDVIEQSLGLQWRYAEAQAPAHSGEAQSHESLIAPPRS